jgi:glycosyltransferase involved in cell wall biosynthesis
MAQVSIGIPAYNGEKYLPAALDSLLAQSFKDFEIVISDNASTDRTYEICQAYEVKDTRIRYFRNDRNLGAAWNHNRVVELSSAPLFKWAACDDLLAPFFLERCVEVLYENPSVVLSHTYVKMIDENGELLRYDGDCCSFVDSSGRPVPPPDRKHVAESLEPEARFRDVICHAWWCFQCFGVMRRDALLRTSLHGNYWGADKVLLAELALLGRFHQVNEPLFSQRIHKESSFGAKDIHVLERHMDTSGSRGLYHVLMFKDYLKLVATADLSLRQRIHCLSSVARLTVRPGPWREVLHRFDLGLGRT